MAADRQWLAVANLQSNGNDCHKTFQISAFDLIFLRYLVHSMLSTLPLRTWSQDSAGRLMTYVVINAAHQLQADARETVSRQRKMTNCSFVVTRPHDHGSYCEVRTELKRTQRIPD